MRNKKQLYFPEETKKNALGFKSKPGYTFADFVGLAKDNKSLAEKAWNVIDGELPEEVIYQMMQTLIFVPMSAHCGQMNVERAKEFISEQKKKGRIFERNFTPSLENDDWDSWEYNDGPIKLDKDHCWVIETSDEESPEVWVDRNYKMYSFDDVVKICNNQVSLASKIWDELLFAKKKKISERL